MAADPRSRAYPSKAVRLFCGLVLMLNGACDNGNHPVTSISSVREAVGQVTVAASAPSVTVGQSITLTATVTTIEGVRLTDRPVSWTVSQPALATVTPTGLTAILGARSAGTLQVTAMTGGVSSTLDISIRAASASASVASPAAANSPTSAPPTIR